VLSCASALGGSPRAALAAPTYPAVPPACGVRKYDLPANGHFRTADEFTHPTGYKQSGYGKDLSAYSLEDYTQIKHVMAKLD
jgi:hypothetical protein